jgi:UDP-sugar diphosphatase
MYNIEIKGFTDLENPKYIKTKRMHYIQNGIEKNWEIAEVYDSIAIFLIDIEKQEVVLVKQFRPAIYLKNNDGFSYELCAGLVDKNKSLKEIAKDEVLEECGYEVDVNNIKKITSYFSAVGFAGAKQTMFYTIVSDKIKISNGGGIDNEAIEIIKIKFSEMENFIYNEEVARTPAVIFAFQWLINKLKNMEDI